MILLPEADWPPEGAGNGSFLTGAATPLPSGTFRLPSDPNLPASAGPADDPVSRADTLRERAGQVFQRQRAIGRFNRGLDQLFANIAESADWSEGLGKFDKEIGNLRQQHLAELRTPEDRAAFERHTQEFAAMQRIGLKSALVERQHTDALAQLDDQIAYYVGKAAAAPNDVSRQLAIGAGERAIAELRDAGYLFPEEAEKRRRAFLDLIDSADLETIVNANPDEALGILDNPALFPRVDAAARERLKGKLRLLPATDEPSPNRTMEWREDRDGPLVEPVPLTAAPPAATNGDLKIDDVTEAPAQDAEPLSPQPNTESLAEWPTGANTTPPDMATHLATLLGPALVAVLATPPGRLILSRLAPATSRVAAKSEAMPKPATEPPSPISPPRVKPPHLPPPSLERDPAGPPQDERDQSAAPTYSPTKPISSGAERYKRVGNREFVQYSDGSVDFGEISADVAGQIQRERGIQVEAAPIRLGRGRSRHEGELHLERGGKAKEIRDAGYGSAADLVDDVGNHFTEIWQGEGETLLLVKRSPDESSPMLYVEIRKPISGRYYDVKSGGNWRSDYPSDENRVLLWRGERTSSTAAGGQEP